LAPAVQVNRPPSKKPAGREPEMVAVNVRVALATAVTVPVSV